jgi:hypothetical protein
MDRYRVASFLVAGALLSGSALAHTRGLPETPGRLVSVSVQIEGRDSPLFRAPDGSGRFYVEAREGRRYAVNLANRTGGRVGVVVTVDGLNVISGQRDAGRGRMNVLDPWPRPTARGWRTSLEEVHQFTFVDERASYATRSGKANEKMGWIEVAVFRESRPLVQWRPRLQSPPAPSTREYDEAGTREEAAEPEAARDAAEGAAKAVGRARSFPGTGWGERAQDPVVLVSFEPEPVPCEQTTLRYEYRPALVALGVLPRPTPRRDRLWERDHAESGFAQPPVW